MSGRHPAAMGQPDKRADAVIEDAVQQGYVDSERPYVIPGFITHAAANDGRLSVNRSARRRNLGSAAWVADQDGQPCYKDCADPAAPHKVHFRLWSKERARAHVFRQSGGDPANLKYNPWKGNRNRRFSDSGEPG